VPIFWDTTFFPLDYSVRLSHSTSLPIKHGSKPYSSCFSIFAKACKTNKSPTNFLILERNPGQMDTQSKNRERKLSPSFYFSRPFQHCKIIASNSIYMFWHEKLLNCEPLHRLNIYPLQRSRCPHDNGRCWRFRLWILPSDQRRHGFRKD